MAELRSSSRPSSSSSFSLPSSSSSRKSFPSLLLWFLTVLPLSLAFLAFLLQWRGEPTDTVKRWSTQPFNDPAVDIYGSNSDPGRRSGSGRVDILGRSNSPAFPYLREWKFDTGSNLTPKICIVSSTSAGLEQTLPWIFYHKVIGVSAFFLFVEGKAATPNASKVLESIPGVKVIYRTKELEEQQAKSRIWNETWLDIFFYKPCNSELFVKQNLNMEMSIVMARDAGMDWIIHLDTDELVHPSGAPEYSLSQLLSGVPENVDTVVFSNYESCVERDDVKEPFTEVSMFKKNYDHLPKAVYFGSYKEATRGNPNYFLTYGNGKSAARIQNHLRPHGAHRWHNYMKIYLAIRSFRMSFRYWCDQGTPRRQVTVQTYEIKLDEAAVLHYTYAKFSDLTSRRDRCGCKPTKDAIKRCFMLEFDRDAFIIASTATKEEMLQWYREHVVWTDKELKLKLLRRGILTRIYTPMVIIQGLRESGLFASVIQSAQTTISKDKSLSSVETSNSSRVDEPGIISSGRLPSRRIMEITENFSYTSADPPLSPPVLHDLHIRI